MIRWVLGATVILVMLPSGGSQPTPSVNVSASMSIVVVRPSIIASTSSMIASGVSECGA